MQWTKKCYCDGMYDNAKPENAVQCVGVRRLRQLERKNDLGTCVAMMMRRRIHRRNEWWREITFDDNSSRLHTLCDDGWTSDGQDDKLEKWRRPLVLNLNQFIYMIITLMYNNMYMGTIGNSRCCWVPPPWDNNWKSKLLHSESVASLSFLSCCATFSPKFIHITRELPKPRPLFK